MSAIFSVADLKKYFPPEDNDSQLRAIDSQVGPLDIAHYSALSSLWLEMVRDIGPWFGSSKWAD